jgi:hypothetical protein
VLGEAIKVPVAWKRQDPWTWTGAGAGATRLARPGAVALTVVLVGWAIVLFDATFSGAIARGEVGSDAALYMSSAQRWLATGDLYYPHQLAGPYHAMGTVMLYPPVALFLFVPMAYLPGILWWAVPLGIIAWHVWDARPGWWTWPILAALAGTVPVAAVLTYGNTEMWTTAFVALACRWSFPALAIAVKPTTLPVALLFCRDRRWWIALAVLIAACLPFGLLWVDWLNAMQNLEGVSPLYSLGAPSWLAFIGVAWLGRRREVAEPSRPDSPRAN